MLKSYLTALPYTKFVLIEDTFEHQGKQIFDFLVKNHLNRTQNTVHFFVFHGSFYRIKSNLSSYSNILIHDLVNSNIEDEFESIVLRLRKSDIVVIDSLVHVIYKYGLAETYKVINMLKNENGIQQIISVFHTDLLENKDEVIKYFEHISSLSLKVDPNFTSENGRLSYIYKKSGGKILKQIEEYYFEGETLITKKIEKLDPKKLLENSLPIKVNPETLSTFKIGLTDMEKDAREQLILPYLPKDETEHKEDGGAIFYKFDAVDDWDEEDPDDDLDI